jgi:hypothetical protein
LNIAKLVLGFIMSVLAGVLGNVIWDRIKTGGISIPHFATTQLGLFVGVALSGFFFGWMSRAVGKAVDAEKFASFMRQGRELYEHFLSLRIPEELNGNQSQVAAWVRETSTFLKQSRLPIDAEAFLQIGGLIPSAEQLSEFSDLQDWKRHDLFLLSQYRHKLDHIREHWRIG